ncbi:MAG TPA: hypothetical protein VK989_08070 [Polyangia bacterium]|jgi:hypothetical protein|nr:hypothetical protein [Polyangia bacterium]
MIRNTMLGLSLLALTGASAFAAPAVHHTATRMVAEGDAPPAADAKPKKEKKAKKAKADKKADAPAPEAK